MFPTRVRYTAMSFPYHVGTGWVGGFLPVTSFALVAITGNIYEGLWYSVVFTAISVVVSLLFLKETAGRAAGGSLESQKEAMYVERAVVGNRRRSVTEDSVATCRRCAGAGHFSPADLTRSTFRRTMYSSTDAGTVSQRPSCILDLSHRTPKAIDGGLPDDIALLRLETDVKDATIACLYDGADELGKPVVVAGMGVPGIGTSGVGKTDGALRAATVTVDTVAANVISWIFRPPGDPKSTPLEGISGPGDSGGPAFIERSGQYCVAGISSAQDTKDGPQGLIMHGLVKASHGHQWMSIGCSASASTRPIGSFELWPSAIACSSSSRLSWPVMVISSVRADRIAARVSVTRAHRRFGRQRVGHDPDRAARLGRIERRLQVGPLEDRRGMPVRAHAEPHQIGRPRQVLEPRIGRIAGELVVGDLGRDRDHPRAGRQEGARDLADVGEVAVHRHQPVVGRE